MTTVIRAGVHCFGSDSGYRVLAVSNDVTAAERSALDPMTTGVAEVGPSVEAVGQIKTMLVRTMPGGRMALTRWFAGKADDNGRPTLELRTMLFGSQDWADGGRLMARHLLDHHPAWDDDGFSSGGSIVVELPGTALSTADRDIFRLADLVRPNAMPLRLSDDRGMREALVGLVERMQGEESKHLQWGVGLAHAARGLDIMTLTRGATIETLEHEWHRADLRDATGGLMPSLTAPPVDIDFEAPVSQSQPTPPRRPSEPHWSPPERSRSVAPLIAAVLALLVVAAALWWSLPHGEPNDAEGVAAAPRKPITTQPVAPEPTDTTSGFTDGSQRPRVFGPGREGVPATTEAADTHDTTGPRTPALDGGGLGGGVSGALADPNADQEAAEKAPGDQPVPSPVDDPTTGGADGSDDSASQAGDGASQRDPAEEQDQDQGDGANGDGTSDDGTGDPSSGDPAEGPEPEAGGDSDGVAEAGTPETGDDDTSTADSDVGSDGDAAPPADADSTDTAGAIVPGAAGLDEPSADDPKADLMRAQAFDASLGMFKPRETLASFGQLTEGWSAEKPLSTQVISARNAWCDRLLDRHALTVLEDRWLEPAFVQVQWGPAASLAWVQVQGVMASSEATRDQATEAARDRIGSLNELCEAVDLVIAIEANLQKGKRVVNYPSEKPVRWLKDHGEGCLPPGHDSMTADLLRTWTVPTQRVRALNSLSQALDRSRTHVRDWLQKEEPHGKIP